MKKAIIRKNGITLTENCQVADSFFTRFKGLMFRRSIPDDYALHITPCNQVHMLNMRFPIDVIYLDASGTVVKIDENVQPGKICKTVKNAKSVIEVTGFYSSENNIRQGDMIEVSLTGGNI
ncbi:MAG: DUF192 domain-containing protein [Ruminococcaceae bacterium]|nr:DUF192 domain-containing protein [Oscillospiraceae bacterium]